MRTPQPNRTTQRLDWVLRFFALTTFLLIAGAALSDAPETVALEVTIHGRGEQALDAYVALIQPDRPASQPTIETVAPLGRTILRVSPGSYRLFAGSNGFEDASRTVRVTSSMHQVRLDVEPRVLAKGSVVDETGRPLEDSMVTQVRLLGLQLSDLGRRYFGGEWTTHTDAQGRWSLAADSRGKLPALIEAAGYAPALIWEAPGETYRTTLKAGASLQVELDHADPDVIVTLVRQSGDPTDLPPDFQSVVWTRTLDNKSVAWPSLPPGEYRLIARYTDPRRFSHPIEISSVSLPVGRRAKLHLTLPPHVAPDPTAPLLFVQGKSTTDMLAAASYVMTSNGEADEVLYATQTVSGGVVVAVKTHARPDEVWMVTPTLVIAGRRSTVIPNIDSAFETVISKRASASLRVHPVGTDLPLPRWTTARFDACEFKEGFIVSAPIASDGSVDLPFPSACHAVTLRLPPFEPLLIETQLQPDERRHLGDYAVHPGGIADVHAVHDPTITPAIHAAVQVTSRTEAGRRMVVTEAVTDENGRALLVGLPVDRDLNFEATDPATGFSGSVTERFEAGQKKSIDPLAIPVPARLVFAPHLAPEFRDQFKDARIDRVTIDHESGDPDLRRTTSPAKNGEAIFDDLRPGVWRPYVLVEAGGSLQPVTGEDLTLHAGENRRVDSEVAPSVFQGTALSGGKGVAAMIGFAEEPSPTTLVRVVRSGTDGHFNIILPSAGVYGVRVTPASRKERHVQLGEIELTDPRTPIMLRLPDSIVLARVKDNERPAANVTVRAVQSRSSLRGGVVRLVEEAATNAAGEARFDPIAEGRWTFEARSTDGRKSAQTSIQLAGDAAAALDLELATPSTFAGFVHDNEDHPVPRAQVDCMYVGPGNLPQFSGSTADERGFFSFGLPIVVPSLLHCGVTTPGGSIAAFESPPTTSADFVMPSETAQLSIPDWGKKLEPDVYWLVADDGRMFDLTWAASKLAVLWSPLHIAALPAESWKIVRADTLEQQVRLATLGGNSLSSIDELSLRQGDSRTVRFYKSSGR